MLIIVLILYFLSFLIIWQFVGYPTLMAIIARRNNPKDKDYSYHPFVSIIVPTYNEENVIGDRIKNLNHLNYMNDNYEIIVVDSGSNDRTRDIVRRKIKENAGMPELKLLIEKERNGKASAINYGKRHSKGNIILVTDANSIFNKNVLKEIVPHFKNPKIGAVGGMYCITNNLKNSITQSESFYWDLEIIMRLGESKIDSACLFHGEINAWRKNIVNADTHALSEDLDMCIAIRKKGYKIEYEPGAVVYEPSATNSSDQIKQRKRTSIGTIQNIFKYHSYFFLPRDIYTLLTFPSHKTLAVMSPFIFILILAGYIIISVLGMLEVVITHLLVTLSLFMLLFILLMNLKSKIIQNDSISKFKIKKIFHVIHYVILNEFLLLLAWKDFIMGRYSVFWEKVASTRE